MQGLSKAFVAPYVLDASRFWPNPLPVLLAPQRWLSLPAPFKANPPQSDASYIRPPAATVDLPTLHPNTTPVPPCQLWSTPEGYPDAAGPVALVPVANRSTPPTLLRGFLPASPQWVRQRSGGAGRSLSVFREIPVLRERPHEPNSALFILIHIHHVYQISFALLMQG